jgi:hypothetical protein
MDGVIGLRARERALSAHTADLGSQARHAGARRLFGLPVEQAGDCTVRIQAGEAGRCAVCSGRYAAGDWIGHSREADGWVAPCCM